MAFTCCCGSGHLDDLDLVDLDHLAAGQARGRFGARLVLRVLDVDVLLARLGLGVDVDERARADLAVDLLEGVGVGDFLGHHEGHLRRRLAERVEHQAVGFFQDHLEGLGVDRLEVLHEVHELLSHRIARRPALDRGHAVGSGDRLAVVPFQAVTQREGPQHLVGRDLVLVDHLRLDGVVLVDREQRVVDHVAVVAGDVGRRPDRVEDRQVAVLHELQDLALRRGPDAASPPRGACRQRAQFTPHDRLGFHRSSPPTLICAEEDDGPRPACRPFPVRYVTSW